MVCLSVNINANRSKTITIYNLGRRTFTIMLQIDKSKRLLQNKNIFKSNFHDSNVVLKDTI